MPEQFLTPDFWKAQLDVVFTAPWLVIPLLVLAAIAAWKLKGNIDDGEVKALRAERDTFKLRLELVEGKSESDSLELFALRRDTATIRQDMEALKGSIDAETARAVASALGAVATDTERRAITLISSNSEIRDIVSRPVATGDEAEAVIPPT